MENNFELEQMKQQWSTLQTALESQKEINIKLIVRDAKRHIGWTKDYLRASFFILIFFVIPMLLWKLHLLNVPLPNYIAINLIMCALSINALYMSTIIKTPTDSNIDVLKYGRSLVKFKKTYLWSELLATLAVIIVAIWTMILMEVNMTNPTVTTAVIAAIIGALIGLTFDLRVLNNIKELQSDIDLIEDLQEQI